MSKPIGYLLLVLCILGVTLPANAANPGFGLGIIVGEPTGLSLKSWLSRDSAIDAALAWSFVDHNEHNHYEVMQLHADYLLHNFSLFRVSQGKLPLYYGIGGVGRFYQYDDDWEGDHHDEHSVRLGVRVPLGISYLFSRAPFDLFLEVVPMLALVPETDFWINAAFGGRFYF